ILSLVTLRLTRAGYEVVTAADGKTALELAHARRPVLAVLDVMMPRLSGVEVLSKLRASVDLAGLKVILLSARVLEPDVSRGLEAGADSYMLKPFRATELVDEVGRLLG